MRPVFICILCRTVNESDHDYADSYTCRECGQQYEYEEGVRIVLTPEQIELLRAQHPTPLVVSTGGN